VIAFVGSVFSPYYAWARRRGAADPDNFCALNVALYGRTRRWAMTERGSRHCARDARLFQIGPSRVTWDGTRLCIDVHERCVPIPRALRGRIVVQPERLFNFSTALEPSGSHRWGPIAPSARVDVDFDSPDLRWTGHAYLDSNEGDTPIATACREWDWSRSRMADGSTVVLYDVQGSQDAGDRLLSLRFGVDGQVDPVPAPPRQRLPRTLWGIARRMRSDGPVRVIDQLEDTPFYQRAVLQSELLGERALSFHETLNVPRLVSPVVQAMLPWRMPRTG
jgi:carotenoid 1,2-hydratase